MAVIHILDKHTAELIAAGEVVERPSSVVKELVENSIDAGSRAIRVSIQRGGVGEIEVSDDGSGIEAEYIPAAFIRHATSKIETEQDLAAIGTLGFRGEALASISAVSRVELLTKTEKDEYACLYRQEGGEEISAEAAARPVGTTVTVRDLFYNVPARMKFLKRDVSEGNYVGDAVARLALAHPEVSFTFRRENREVFRTPGDGEILSAVYAVLSKEFAQTLLPIRAQGGKADVSGYVTAPIHSRQSRSMQYFYINGRTVEDRTLMAALEAAYRGVIMQGRYPGCVLNVRLPYESVDVNVHPAKIEVRFSDPGAVFDLVYRAVRSVVISPDTPKKDLEIPAEKAAPAPEVGKECTPAELTGPTGSMSADNAAPVPGSDGFGSAAVSYAHGFRSSPRSDIDIEKTPEEEPDLQGKDRGAPVQTRLAETAPSAAPDTRGTSADGQPLRYLGEAFGTYLIAETGEDLVLIDKHAAHERIRYEKLSAGFGKTEGQLLLRPVSVLLGAEEKNALLGAGDLLAATGFEAEDYGGASVLVRSVPFDIREDDVSLLTEELASRLALNAHATRSERTEWVLHSIACRGAIKAGETQQPAELLELARRVLSGTMPPFCPHGRPVLIHLSKKELEKQFGRIG